MDNASTPDTIFQNVQRVDIVIHLDDFCTQNLDDDGMRNWDECHTDHERVAIFQKNLHEELSQTFPNAAIHTSQDFRDYSPYPPVRITFPDTIPHDDEADVYETIAEVYQELL